MKKTISITYDFDDYDKIRLMLGIPSDEKIDSFSEDKNGHLIIKCYK